jgi:NTE family protein
VTDKQFEDKGRDMNRVKLLPGVGLCGRVMAGLLSLLVAAAPRAQMTSEAPRPRVGLVLGGGGARGAAHIGVLEVLERLRVPVDCVAGTSMGGLVAGTFAAGVTPAEMREAMAKADWTDMFQDNPAFYDMSYRNKRLSQAFLPGSELGVTDQGLQYAPGVVTGQKIKAFFNQLVRADRGERLIEDLPLPLSIVATDIGTGARIVMRDGSLTEAMRASMSVPGLMAPVERDGRLLVDGGLVDNVPIAEARERCQADTLIVVNVGSPLLKANQIGSLISVTAQMVNILTQQNVTRSLATIEATDIYIKPDLEGISAGDFQRNGETADRGRNAAVAAGEQLKRLSVGEAQYADWRRRIDSLEIAPRRVDEIQIAGLQRVNPADVEWQISQKTGEPLNTPVLNQDLLRVYGEGYYERVDYKLLRERDRSILRIAPVEKAWGPDYLRFGLGLETDFSTGSTYVLRAAYHKTWMNSLGAELLLAAEIGNRTRLAVDLYQPVEPTQRYFIEPRIAFQRQNLYVFQNDQKLAEMEIYDTTGEVAFGTRIGTLGQAKVGWQETHKSASVDIGLPLVQGYRVRYGGWFASVDLDHLDRIYVPRRGWAAAARYFDSPSQGFSKFEVELRGAYPMGDFVFQGRLSYAGSPVGQLPDYDPTKLGGFLNMSAFARDQLIGDDAGYAGVRIERIVGRLPLGLRGDMRVGLSLEGSRMGLRYTETTLAAWQNSIGLYLGGETPIGPVFIGYGYSPSSGYANAYLLIGTP